MRSLGVCLALQPPARRPAPPPTLGPTWPLYVGLAGAATAAVVGGTALAMAEDRRVTAFRRARQISPMNECAVPRPGCDEVTETAEEYSCSMRHPVRR
ncbi:hypothetical protein [Sorangium sp. So ce513]|uniref:hypothetical protein n=1 Tax=Sorangium sp. So ce513 TaxID=3133315 RepID=UPI003F6401DA